MTLQEFLEQSGMSQKAFAAKIRRTQVTVSRLCSGASRPSLDLAFEIEAETNGSVKASSWAAKPIAQTDEAA